MDLMALQPNSLNNALSAYNDNTKQTVLYGFFPHFKVTEGVKCAVEKYSLHWLMIIIFTAQKASALSYEPLQVWQVQRISDKKLMLIADNGLGVVIFNEKVNDKTFMYDYLKLFWVEGLLLLPSETKGK
jgi:hypothetical protein